MRSRTVYEYLLVTIRYTPLDDLRPHSRPRRWGNLDRRTYEAKIYEDFRLRLIDYVGGKPTLPQSALIERAAWVYLRCAVMESKVGPIGLTDIDARSYLAWTNTLAKVLAHLGVTEQSFAEKPTPSSFDDYAASRRERRAAFTDEKPTRRRSTEPDDHLPRRRGAA